MVQEFLLRLQETWQLSRPKTIDSEAVLQAIEVNLVSSTRRVSGKFNTSQSSVVHHPHDCDKSNLSY